MHVSVAGQLWRQPTPPSGAASPRDGGLSPEPPRTSEGCSWSQHALTDTSALSGQSMSREVVIRIPIRP